MRHISGLLMLLALSPLSVASAATYQVNGADMGPRYENVHVTSNGAAYSAATVGVNGVNIAPSSPGYYYGALPSNVAVGSQLNLSVAVPEGTIAAHDAVPELPLVTTPTAGASLQIDQPLVVSWNSSSNMGSCRRLCRWERR